MTASSRFDTVSLVTDFGHVDEFVGVVKSVVRANAAHVTFIDISHEIPPHDVRAASLALLRAAPYLVPGVLIAAVDAGAPDRRHIAVELGDGESVLVGPDNGIFAPLVTMIGAASAVVELAAEWEGWFPARDLYAPVTARLCNGARVSELGRRLDASSLVPGMLPFSSEHDGVVEGSVLHIDRYGNALLNISSEQLLSFGDQMTLRFGERRCAVRIVESPVHLQDGETGLLAMPDGMTAISMRDASASTHHALGVDSSIAVESRQSDATE